MTALSSRTGDIRLAIDPAGLPGDAHVVFIGRVHSAWADTTVAPKNPTAARQTGASATLEIDEPFRAGLRGLEGTSHILVVAWLHKAARDVIGLHPAHASAPRGVFALRSPVRPNPIGISVARVLALDVDAGRITVDAIDFLDGTPLIDIKPYRPGIDSVPDAVVG
jgi:tRNA (adenine37-N6)-methyltransferase